jgi:hypothetical protein
MRYRIASFLSDQHCLVAPYACPSEHWSQVQQHFRAVGAGVDVIGPMIVAALENGNDAVGVIDTVDAQGPISFVSIATMRSSNSTPRAESSASMTSSIRVTSRCEAHSID